MGELTKFDWAAALRTLDGTPVLHPRNKVDLPAAHCERKFIATILTGRRQKKVRRPHTGAKFVEARARFGPSREVEGLKALSGLAEG